MEIMGLLPIVSSELEASGMGLGSRDEARGVELEQGFGRWVDTCAPLGFFTVDKEVDSRAGSCFTGAPQLRMDCLHNFLQNIITSLHILKETI